jgi:outer membrane protein
MLRSNLFVALVVGGLAVAPLTAHAELKIGVVNFEALLQESPQLKAMRQTLQDEFSPRERDLVQQQKDLKTKADNFQKNAAVMSEAEKSKVERELREGQRDLERKGNEFKDDANLRQNEEIGKLQRALIAEVQNFAKSGNYDLVVGQGVLYAKDSIDITGQVLTAIQQRAPKPAASGAKPATPAKP